MAKHGKVEYSPGFALAWKAYPHHPNRMDKREAFKRWKALGLEGEASGVLAWIEALKDSPQWQEDGGQYVPGFKVWIKGPEFSDPPPRYGIKHRDTPEQRKANILAFDRKYGS